MDSKIPAVYFSGDMSDPWVVDIAAALADFRLIPCEGEGRGIPSRPFDPSDPAEALVLHRSRLSPVDVERLVELRRGLGAERWPKIAVCVGPYARYAEVERVTSLVECVLPEATARETLPRRLARMLGAPAERPARPENEAPVVDIVSANFDLRRVLAEACLRAGYRAVESPSFSESHHGADATALTVWDVPVLEPRWAECLEKRSRTGPVVALLGFADRDLVALARKSGASACLDKLFIVDDLIDVLDRLASTSSTPSPVRFQPPHATPPPPVGRARREGARSGRRAADPL